MLNTKKRFDFIVDYLNNYESKIKLLNSIGLFDEAKHFELFAQEVCNLWFKKKFINLNTYKPNYPYVDLLSEDNVTYIQVSTVKDAPSKISDTLKNIKDSKKEEFKAIINLKFFFLSNDNIEKISDNIIEGNIVFSKLNDLITTKSIIEKAMSDFDFQKDLYELLQKDIMLKEDFDNLNEAIEKSKFDISQNIDPYINNEYEIDRSKIIDEIIKDNNKNIVILGNAGSGKSVLCKNLISNEKNVLYARAERFIDKKNINDIWSFDLKNVLDFNNENLVIFIDSLEYIADNYKKDNLFPYLYEITKNIENVKIITSCRSSDYNAFIKLTSEYNIKTYEINELTEIELLNIAFKYPIIKQLSADSNYAQLLKSPFYINQIVSKIKDFQNISNENDFREHIWNKIICQDDDDIKKTVNQIVFDRAKNYLLYVNIDQFDSKKINQLLSAGIIIKSDSGIRLKYDIFEDICFERYFNLEFNNCRGNYKLFFDKISTMGRCIYRRYQIWLSNNLLNKINRDNIIYNLIFADTVPNDWKKETMIGLIRSRFSSEFFSENADMLIKKNKLNDFIYLTNLYGFKVNTSLLAKFSSIISLTPSGQGRSNLIKIIFDKKIYEETELVEQSVLKLLDDYSKLPENNREENISFYVFEIIKKYLENDLKYILDENNKSKLYGRNEYSVSLLKIIYQFSKLGKEWISSYWDNIVNLYKGDDREKERYAEQIIEFTLSFDNSILAVIMPEKLCGLAEMYWTYTQPPKRGDYMSTIPYNQEDKKYLQFGLSYKADSYEHKHYWDNVVTSSFFYTLFYRNFWIGLKWAVNFINNAIEVYSKKNKSNILECEINFFDEDVERIYLGNYEMWLATTEEYQLPTLLSDLLYILQSQIEEFLKNKNIGINKRVDFAKNVKKYIYESSNNIALLSIISYIGIKFENILSGYSLDLLTNKAILKFDLHRKAKIMVNPLIKRIEQQIYTSIGIPNIRKRYKNDSTVDLQQYLINMQLLGSKESKERCYKILDFLYSITPNDKNNASDYLQIQKMDLRNAKIEEVDDKTYAIIPNITGEANKIVEDNDKNNERQKFVETEMGNLQKEYSDITLIPIEKIIDIIELILKERSNFMVSGIYDAHLIGYIGFALMNDKLLKSYREKYCQILIEGINGYLTNNQSINFDIPNCIILFEQLKMDIPLNLKNKIKLIILDSILSRSTSGLVKEISQYAKQHLKKNTKIAVAVFNTIIKLAEDEMNYQVYNANYLKTVEGNESFKLIPNITRKLYGVDRLIDERNDSKFISKKKDIIDKYLFEEESLVIEEFDIKNYDVNLLCYAINCGLSIYESNMPMITKEVLKILIEIWYYYKNNSNSHDIIDFDAEHQTIDFLGFELIKDEEISEIISDILFSDIDFSKFTSKTIKFYQNIFFNIVPHYFDAHSNFAIRNFCTELILKMEERINLIKDETVKTELLRSITFYFPEFKAKNNWLQCGSNYSIEDKNFINNQLKKYSYNHLEDLFITVYQFHLDKLLPEILIGINESFIKAKQEDGDNFKKVIIENKSYILSIISKGFISFSEEIKQDEKITDAFENILNYLCDMGFEEAAVIFDEFRIH